MNHLQATAAERSVAAGSTAGVGNQQRQQPAPGARAVALLLVLAALATSAHPAASAAPAAPAEPAAPRAAGMVDAERVIHADAEPHNWLAHGRTYGEARYSPLTAINRDSVGRIGLTWAFGTGTHRGMEATPIVVDGVMYVTSSWSRVFALDAASGRELWRFDPQVPGAVGRKACCDVVNRGVAVWQGRVYLGALDGRLIALDAATGKLLWQVQTVDPARGYTITGAPRVVRDKVIIGNGGAEYGVRGYVSAYAASSGDLVWRFYTVPGAPDQPDEHPELTMARLTWSPDSQWETGLGGTVWDSIAYDAELNQLYVGVGNSSNYNRAQRSPGGGDNLFLASILALNPDTGRLLWHYQTTPAEHWDYTAVQHMILADLNINGAQRKVLLQAPKNGFFYVLDRVTGEFISAEKYVPANWASHVDPETGRPVETGRADWTEQTRYVTPGPTGGHNWHPMSFSPRTGLVYVPSIEAVFPFVPLRDYRFVPGKWNTGEDWATALSSDTPPPVRFCSPTHLTAWDPVAQKQRWRVNHRSTVPAGVLSTAGGLVFQGSSDGRLVAYADDSGEVLWQQDVGVGIMAPPVSYAVDGQQYIAVLAGIGGAQGLLRLEGLERNNPGHVFAFRLDGKATPPQIDDWQPGEPDLGNFRITGADVEHGRRLFTEHCMTCHGPFARSSGVVKDLRHSPRAIHEMWPQIVLEGVFSSMGMASFADLLNADDVRDIHAYVLKQAVESESTWAKISDYAREAICVPASWLAD